MRKHFQLILMLSTATEFFFCCGQTNEVNHFNSSQDTIHIVTKTYKGGGEFERIFAHLRFDNSFEQLTYSVKLPTELTEIKNTFWVVDWKAYQYMEFLKDENSELPEYLINAFQENKLDSSQLPTREQNQIDIISGMKNSIPVFVFDENNNQDLTDDSVRTYKPMPWNKDENLIKSEFYIYNGKHLVKDSTWIKIGTPGSRPILLIGVAEHVTADFYLDDKFYQLGVANYQSGYAYQDPTYILLINDSVPKDSVYFKDTLYPNEFIQLNDNYYRISNVSNDGGMVTLIREYNFSSKTGTQVGIKAPQFTAFSTDGDTINSSNMHDKPLLIANTCECGGDVESLNAYFQIQEKFGDKTRVLHLDSGMPKLDKEQGIHIDTEDENNAKLYEHFRGTYCSRVCYVIKEENVVIDKFYINDWKEALSTYLDD